MNPIVKLCLFFDEKYILNENDIETLTKWFNALGSPEFEDYLANVYFNKNVELPKGLLWFKKYKIPGIIVSEAAVERCFSIHKRIHTPIRASLSSDTVENILFIRYNHPYDFNASNVDGDDCSDCKEIASFDDD